MRMRPRSHWLWLVCWYWMPPMVYATGIFALSSLSHPEVLLPSFFHALRDTSLHLMEYAGLGALCYRAFRYAAGAWGGRYSLPLAVLAASLYGVTDEVHQAFVPFREASGADWMADTVGAMLGAGSGRWVCLLVGNHPSTSLSDDSHLVS